jgi:hypothetical protein
MRTHMIHALIAILAVAALVAASPANAAWGTRTKNISLSAFAVTETKSDQSGYGIALTKYGREVADLAFVDLGDFRMAQFSKLAPKQVGPWALNFGFAIAYADPKEGVVGAPDKLLTGLSVILAKSEIALGLSFDLRASSLSKDFDPIAWFTDPDVLWLGAGLSYSF